MPGTVANITYPPAPRNSPPLTSLLILVPQRLWPGEASNLPNVSGVRSGRAGNPNQCSNLLLHSSLLSPTTPPLWWAGQTAWQSTSRKQKPLFRELERRLSAPEERKGIFTAQASSLCSPQGAPGCRGQERNIHLFSSNTELTLRGTSWAE